MDISTLTRMWINQPSALQPLHALHGTNVLAYPETPTTTRIYFLSGNSISQQASPLCLSEGWRETADTQLVLPIVHLNGDSKQTLVEQRCDALEALAAASGALGNMAPNGRNYYPVDGLMGKAVAQHQRRAKVLQDLYAEIEREVEGLDTL